MGFTTTRAVQQAKYQQSQVEHPKIERIKELAKATLGQPEIRSINKFIDIFNEI